MTKRSLLLTYVALMILAIASWVFAAVGGTGTALAIAIAAVKAILIGLVFMELRRGHAVDQIIAVVAIFFVILLTAGSLADVAFR